MQEVSYLFTMNGVICINKNRIFSDRVHAPLSAIYSKDKVCYSVGSHQAFHHNDGITGRDRRVGYFEASGPGVKHIYHGDFIYIAFGSNRNRTMRVPLMSVWLSASYFIWFKTKVRYFVGWVIRKKFNVIGREMALQCIRDYR